MLTQRLTQWRAGSLPVFVSVCALTAITGCAPTVKVEAPEKPIEITMNVNINHEIRVKVEKDIDEMVEDNPDLY